MNECEERKFWHKQFIFASWLLLFFGIWALFSDSLGGVILAITLSLIYRVINTILDIRHLKWHINNDKGGHYM